MIKQFLAAIACIPSLIGPVHADNLLPGADRDPHGCIASAGYTWSQLRQSCIRTWQAAIALQALDSTQSATIRAFILVQPTQAELFIASEPESIILHADKKRRYRNGIYLLTLKQRHWQLSVNGKLLYRSR
jgi:hypothetical protein